MWKLLYFIVSFAYCGNNFIELKEWFLLKENVAPISGFKSELISIQG